MSEVVDTVTGEVIEDKMLAVKSESQKALSSLVKDADKALFDAMSDLQSMDWKNLQPNQMALLLMQKPFSVPGGGTSYLNLRQALLFALRAYELGVSPLSSEIWFDPARGSANLTLEGKKAVARNKGIDLGPPQFDNLEREWDTVPRQSDNVKEAQKAGFKKDIGVRCKIRVGPVGNNEHISYECWLSDWFVPRSPVWRERALHMMMTRATEKAISLAMGTGASDPINDE